MTKRLTTRIGYALLLCGSMTWGQTQIDLRTQARNVDFSGAAATKPAQTGGALPTTCGVGEQFFLTSAPAGSNLYLCATANTWSPASPPAVNQAVNQVYAGPASGSPAIPAFRALTKADEPVTAVYTDQSNTYTAGTQNMTGAGATLPARMGISLPSTCMQGELYIVSTALPGTNLNLCYATNSWAQIGAGSGGGGISATVSLSGSTLTTFPNCASSAPCPVGQGGTVTGSITSSLTPSAPTGGSGAGSASVYIYATLSQACIFGVPSGWTMTGVGTCPVVSGVTSFAAGGSIFNIARADFSYTGGVGTWTGFQNFQPTGNATRVVQCSGSGLNCVDNGQTLTISATGGGSANIPALGSMTQMGFSGGPVTPTASQTSDGTIVLSQPNSTGGNLFSGLLVSAPPTPYTYVLGFYPSHAWNTNYILNGITLRESSSGKLAALDLLSCGTCNNSGPGYILRKLHATQPLVGGGNLDVSTLNELTLPAFFSPFSPLYLAIHNDGTTVTLSLCQTAAAATCQQIASEAVTAWANTTLDQVGFYVDTPASGSFNNAIDVIYFGPAQ